MVRSLLLSMLLSSLALGQERMHQVPDGGAELVPYPSWVLTEQGKARIDAALERNTRELEQLRAENASLRIDIVTWAERPTLTWKGALLLLGGGALLGAAVAVPVALALRR